MEVENVKIQHQYSRKSGYLLLVAGLVMMAIFVAFFLIVYFQIGDRASSQMIFMLIAMSIFVMIPIGLGLFFVITGQKATKIMKTGNKRTCEVYNILNIKNGIQMIISYRGESGAEYKQSVDLPYKSAALIKPGLTIECYIEGERCYVDESNIVIVDKPIGF